ncbi:MAG: putative selenate reductase subunit YgfK [Candidatus Cloacimonetes bacterium]|nr:putative selenate reductase subunit YgfK [Candidatus Cloacimonadota bacterium]
MTDKMIPPSFENLLEWIFQEYEQNNTIFGIHKQQFYNKTNDISYHVLNDWIEEPIGPAAGPHTQLSQNITVSYLCGGRFFELKTVQKLDELEIEKPCIDAPDEGYNTEWSTELTVPQAFEEYLKAWFVLHIIKEVFGLSVNKKSGFIFNMSVGYDLAGIKTKKIDDFIEHLKNAEKNPLFIEYKNILSRFAQHNAEYSKSIEEVLSKISPFISDSITLSTMHSCPPEEIESICEYLIKEKKLHTFVKLNPTLLGYDRVKSILDKHGFTNIVLHKDSFDKDLQFDAAIPMLKRLMIIAENENKKFGVKLSNTLAVANKDTRLPGDEKYMSGRALYPITITLASEISSAFDGILPISYSGGASYWNIIDILNTGIKPITFATDLLKPGGYVRLKQLAAIIEDNHIENKDFIDVQKLYDLAKNTLTDSLFVRKEYTSSDTKIEKELPLFDCFIAPCKERCSIHQDVPEYILAIVEERFDDALRIIYEKNPLPNITGYICDHQCQTKCARWNYENSVSIRELKKVAAERGEIGNLKLETRKLEKRIAILGAGPAGLAGAYFLRKYGFDVTVFEKEAHAGGTVRNVIPDFRIPDDFIQKDIEFLKSVGIEFQFNYQNDDFLEDFSERGFNYVIIGIGAHIPRMLDWCTEKENVFEALSFLRGLKSGDEITLGKKVAIIGGGNSAMDAARAAKRVAGVQEVSILYRRTEEYMPADKEEFDNALDEGIEFIELINPVNFENTQLFCQKMQLGEPDESGRKRPLPIEHVQEIFKCDSVIMAIGESVDRDLLERNGIIFENGTIVFNPDTLETSIENVYIGGDALRGPSTVVESIADGKKAAESILTKEGITFNDEPTVTFDKEQRFNDIREQQGYQKENNEELHSLEDISQESSRCLQCDFLCAKCVEVCPNRANVLINLIGKQHPFKNDFQIIHIDDFCNECGNCATFCPYLGGKPYKDKFTLYFSEESLKKNFNNGVLFQKSEFTLKLDSSLYKGEIVDNMIRWQSDVISKNLDQIEYILQETYKSYLVVKD